MSSDTYPGRSRIAVVGAGASGLSAALLLERLGHDVDLIERDTTLGGRFGVDRLGDRPVMMGGKNIGRKYRYFRSMLSSLGEPRWQSFGINQATMKDDEVMPIDSTRRAKSLGNIRRLGSVRDLARLAEMASRIQLDETNKFLGSRYFSRVAERHDHSSLASHFGDTFTSTLLRAMTVRMNGAEPDEMFLGTFGTNLGLLLDHYDQLEGGIQPLLETVHARVRVRLGTEVESILLRDGEAAGLRTSTAGGAGRDEDFDGVVIAVPAYAAADVFAHELPTLSKRLSEVRYFPTSVTVVEYDRPVFSPEVRALAMNDGGPCSNAGSYGQFERHIVRYTFSGREARAATVDGTKDLDLWLDAAEDRLTRVLGASRARRVQSTTRDWDAAYCGYVPFHGEFLSDVHQAVAAVPNLELAGDYLRGASIEACTRSGDEAARRLAGQVPRGVRGSV